MERPLVGAQAPAEYFKELVESALERQHVQAADLTAYYLVNLLCQFVRPDARNVKRRRGRNGLERAHGCEPFASHESQARRK